MFTVEEDQEEEGNEIIISFSLIPFHLPPSETSSYNLPFPALHSRRFHDCINILQRKRLSKPQIKTKKKKKLAPTSSKKTKKTKKKKKKKKKKKEKNQKNRKGKE